MNTAIPFLYDYVLPHTILPNATPVEMGIVNYINALYSNKCMHGGMFTQDIETSHSLLKTMFGDLLGAWPTSLGGITHLQMPCYSHALRIRENSVYLGKRTVNKYIFPIKVTYHFEEFTGKHHPKSKLNGEFFWKHISAHVLNDIRLGNATLLLDWANESVIDKEIFDDLHESLKIGNIPKDQAILVLNSFNADEVYSKWFKPEEQRLKIINLPFLMSHTSYYYHERFATSNKIEQFKSLRNNIRKHYFLLKIRRARDYRIALLHSLASNNLLEKGNWSCLDQVSAEAGIRKSLKYRQDLNYHIVTRLHDEIPHRLDCENFSDFNNVNGWNDQHDDAYNNSYFYIASETYMTGEYRFVTEKVFKPIANFQPFLFLSCSGALKQLRQLGFKTFENYIDESYDDEQDEIKRFNLIYNEINRLCKMSIEELHNWYWGMEDILIHNHQHLLSIFETDPYILEFSKYLQEKVR